MARATPKTPHKPAAKVRLDRRQRIAWLRLIRTENVGPATFRALVNEFGGAGPSPVDIDELIRSTRLPTRKVHIVMLELAGRLQRHGQLVSLIDR